MHFTEAQIMKKRSNGEGTICKRNDGRWMAQILIDTGYGEFKRKTVYGKTQREVKEKLEQLKSDQKQGRVIETSDMLLEQWMNIWITNYKPDLKITTREDYESYINTHIRGSDLGKIPLNKLKTTDLQSFYNNKLAGTCKGQKKKLSPTTVRYIHVIIKSALNQAIQNRMINNNAANAVVLPKKNKTEIIPLTQEEVIRFLEAARGDRLYALYLLEMMTGLRKGEILGLQWNDIDFKCKRITVSHNLCRIKSRNKNAGKKYELILMNPKTATSKRCIPINDFMADELQKHKLHQMKEKELYGDYYNDLGMVFCKPDGNYIYSRDFLRQYQNLLSKAGLEKKRFHDLRHTVASLLINANENPKMIQQLLGHSNISTTLDIYAHVMDKSMNKSVDKIYQQLGLNSIPQKKNP